MSAKFTMSFTMDNAAFFDEDGSYGDEAERILHEVARKVRTKTGGVILDVNGNKVGRWSVR